MENFPLPKLRLELHFGKPPIQIFAQNSLRFGRRAKRGDFQNLAKFLLAPGGGLEPPISTLTAWRCTNSTTPEQN